MTRILLQFFKTESHYKGETPAFLHELNVEILPKVNEKFFYADWMYNLMDEEAQQLFTSQSFRPSEFFVIGSLEYPEKEYNIDYSFFLIQEMDNQKSGFIELTDIPKE